MQSLSIATHIDPKTPTILFDILYVIFPGFRHLLFALCKAGQKGHYQLRLQPGAELSALVQVRTSENPMINVDILTLNQLPHKCAAQRRAQRTVDSPVIILFDVFF
jgi:hypothetical protein